MATSKKMFISPGEMTLYDLRFAYNNPVEISLKDSAYGPIKESRACVERILVGTLTKYGINTGCGLLASSRINPEDLEEMQRAVVLSHCTGFGEPLDDNMVRLIMVLKINSLARGYSGITMKVLSALIKLVNAEIYPHIPLKGSVGASGDLAPLAHMAAILLGESKARYKDQWISGAAALSIVGLKPITLAPKEGVALINGMQLSIAYALRGLFEAEDMFANAIVCGSLTLEAALGARSPFDARVHEIRGQRSQIDTASLFRYFLGERSDYSDFHINCKKVQDPYSLRCQPQILGACLIQIRQVADVLEVESNAVSDNPLVFEEQDDIISAGNFHAESIAMAADNLALALSEIGALSERRIALLMDKHMSQLPAFLTKNDGVYSGFMTSHISVAALASANKALAHPCSVDSIPTSGNQEDHVSMAPNAGYRLWEMADNVCDILSVEWLAACQGLDLRPGMKTTDILEEARQILRKHVSFYEKDRFFYPDIVEAKKLIKEGNLKKLVPVTSLPSWKTLSTLRPFKSA